MYWLFAIIFSVILSFLTSLAAQLSTTESINWRTIILDVLNNILAMAPLVAAGLGLPRLGKEHIASMVSNLGADEAEYRLKISPSVSSEQIDLDELAKRILEENERRKRSVDTRSIIK